MAHQASYRVYRPRRFSEVLGQARTIDTLREAVRQGRLTHAYLFSGPRGTGKTSVARILAKAVNCENLLPDGNPCLECASCRSIESGQHLDVVEIDAASNRGIDEIRDIRERITHQTAMSRYKVYIIDEVHMLTPEAFNALLKTLEEPPAHVLFVLATTEAHKLPVTVLSRCQRYEFKRLTTALIQERLRFVAEQEGVSATPEALEVLAEAADGAMRDALSLFDQVVATERELTAEGVQRAAGLVGSQEMHKLMGALADGIEPLIGTLEALRLAGLDEKLVLRDVARQFRDILVYRTAGAEVFPGYRRDRIAALSQLFPENVGGSVWIEAADHLAQAESRLRGGFPADLALELALLKIQQALQADVMNEEVRPEPPRPAPRPKAPPPRTTPLSEPPMRSSAPEPEIKRPRDFQSVLDLVKRDRPSTHALIDKAQVRQEENTLAVFLEYPAHLNLVNQAQHREVIDRAIRAVYGPDTRVEFRVGKPDSEEVESAPLPKDGVPLEAEIREWFGSEVVMTGFESDQRKDVER
ncbi:DNA polymerase III subunit gamma/tau [Sulfobacillus harzensis]|uniref:DNA-directed DNA polymerase n=1 Tax=Sulfobacillus harzensis TaxID=2729629 RepID=A0A7Y0Q4X4_9FIRM|nr:DNA polymerase III subunit gamma/tau [Sulfobacillus harzensis]